MAGMQFEYDEEGGTFFYFLLSFWALGLFPATYFCWPRAKASDQQAKKKGICSCEPCLKKNLVRKKQEATVKPMIIKGVLVIGWIIFFLLAYKVSMIQLDYVEYDPFQELEIDRGASTAEIRRAYRKLSLIYHPDKETGDEKRFMRIAKAYAALTDEESRKNWEVYGNPDGPEATRFGIALPKWIVERENSMWVLAVYGLVFMIILPIVVGVWWYRSIKFSSDQVLLDTTRLYYYFINKTPNMILKRAVMILAASCEFDRMHNAEVQDRPSDNEELPQLIKILGNIQEKNRERPLCFPYSVKTRVLLHSHFQRLPLTEDTLGADQGYILKKCPYLINEMINICASLVAMAMSGRVHQPPRLETVENLMKLSQMIVQAIDEKASPLQQLPHISPDMLRHFTTRKRNIRHIRDFVSMKDEDRRQMLRSLGEGEYRDIIQVCGTMPHVEMSIRSEVLDEEDTTITVGSIVTVTVNLVRKDMVGLFDKEIAAVEQIEEDDGPLNGNGDDEADEEDEHDEKQGNSAAGDNKPKVWEKQKKGKKKGGKAKKKSKQPYQWKAVAQAKIDKENAAAASATESTKSKGAAAPAAAGAAGAESEEHEEAEAEAATESGEENNASEDEQDVSGVGGGGGGDAAASEEKALTPKKKEEDDDEDEDWDTFKMESKKENSLETKKKESHTVHCPFFPAEKQEAWWLYVADKKRHLLITAPVHVCSLKEEEEVKLKFSAPAKQGVYHYTVVLRSDSYFGDFDQQQNIKLDVKEAKIVKDHPQWDISDDEEDKANNEDETEEEEDSDYSSEEEGSD
ncbi:translocation protein SEC63 homolog isoform X2 [Babylonia areolata]|uniref:translocation protein SEC63 homolog isoform X2 n=1 Tax=Babylonia areolata TaxID=304850 RepID=UPI003FD4F701